MATEYTYDDEELDPLINSTENLLIRTAREDPIPFKKNTFRPFIFFGRRIPKLHRLGLYLHLLIVCLQYFFFINTQEIIDLALDKNFKNVFQNDFSKPLLSSVSYLLIPFIVYFCDRQMIRRYNLVLSSIFMAFVASCILLILLSLKFFEEDKLDEIIPGYEHSPVVNIKYFIHDIGYIFCVLSYIMFSLSYALSYPFSITFGLDILHGTQYETLLLYFPLFYISKNVGASLSYLVYVKVLGVYPYIHCAVTTLVIFIALVLTLFGRVCGYFQDSAIVANNFSFNQSFKILFAAFKLKFFHRKKADFHSIMLYTARKREYNDPHALVDKSLAMIKINFTLIILIPLLGSYQILYQIFPEQAYFLYFLPFPIIHNSNNEYYCGNTNYFLSYWFINPLTIVIVGPFIEYFFNDILFDTLRPGLPCWVNCISLRIGFIRKNLAYPFRQRLYKHFSLVDPILKRVFWGLPFGLLSAICALTVEIFRINYPIELECKDDTYSLTSIVPLISQIPQYYFSGILEAISAIGLLQYTYHLCSNQFHNSLKGFFFSLFYFYYGVAGVISNIFNFTLDQLCYNNCNKNFVPENGFAPITTNTTTSWCLVDNTDCKTSILPNAWAIWVIVIGLYLLMIPMFYIFSHRNHWGKIREERMFLREISRDRVNISQSVI